MIIVVSIPAMGGKFAIGRSCLHSISVVSSAPWRFVATRAARQ